MWKWILWKQNSSWWYWEGREASSHWREQVSEEHKGKPVANPQGCHRHCPLWCRQGHLVYTSPKGFPFLCGLCAGSVTADSPCHRHTATLASWGHERGKWQCRCRCKTAWDACRGTCLGTQDAGVGYGGKVAPWYPKGTPFHHGTVERKSKGGWKNLSWCQQNGGDGQESRGRWENHAHRETFDRGVATAMEITVPHRQSAAILWPDYHAKGWWRKMDSGCETRERANLCGSSNQGGCGDVFRCH